MKELLVATGNRHKTGEIRALLGEGWAVTDLSAHPDIIPAEETGDTFEANARLKALHLSSALPGLLVLSDDSGLEVDALGGDPGVRSARYAGESATDADNRTKLKATLQEMLSRGESPPLAARFHCCMVLARDGAALGVFHGTVEGSLLLEEEGAGGFGYDPLFVPEGHQHSFGVLPPEVKHGLSHRARAIAGVVEWLKQH